MDSEGIGKGSCFTFTMKMDEVDPNSNSLIDMEHISHAESQSLLLNQNSSPQIVARQHSEVISE